MQGKYALYLLVHNGEQNGSISRHHKALHLSNGYVQHKSAYKLVLVQILILGNKEYIFQIYQYSNYSKFSYKDMRLHTFSKLYIFPD